jgi:photosystem II stability/assembly factor-like uncharacterized protein
MKKLITSLFVLFALTVNFMQAQWVELETGYESPWIFYANSFPPAQNDVGYLAGMYTTYNGDGVIIKTEDGGDTWTTIHPTSGDIDGLQAICFTSVDTGFAGGWNNYFIKTEDGGDTWSEVTVGSDTDIWYFVDIEFWDSNNGVAAAYMNSGGGQPVYITSDGGDTWTQATSGISQLPLDITYADANTLYLVGNGGAISKSTDGGYTWSTIYQSSGITFGVDFEGTSFGVVGGEDGEMLATTDGGSTWSSYSTGYENLWAAKAFTGDSAYLGGTDERIYKTIDGGQTWTLVNSGNTSSPSLYKFAFTQNNTGYVSGSGGAVLMQEAPLSADFEADPTTTCAGSTVDFTDLSAGAISWTWTFEGGTPSTSTDQNPTITYSSPGVYDVSLTVSDGVASVTETKTDYITILETPAKADTPDGETGTCTNVSYFYETNLVDYATGYEWEVTPAAAGSISWEDNVATFTADGTWTGDFTIKVRATNMCGDGEWSDELECTQYVNPEEFNLEGGGSYCLGDDGVEITLSSSQTGIDYELYLDGETTGTVVEGTGSEISFGLQTDEGYYAAYGVTDNCEQIMTGQVLVSIDFPPLEPGTPEGPTAICEEETSDYTTEEQDDADSFVWILTPSEAGTITGEGTTGSVSWDSGFTGTAYVSVYGVNDCGDGNPSFELEVSVGAPNPQISGETLVCDWSDEFYEVAENDGSTYTWTVSGGTIADGQGTYMVTVAWSGEGTGTVSVEEETADGCTGESEMFEVMIDDCTDLFEGAEINDVNIYPNPATHQVNVSFSMTMGEKVNIHVFNTMGQVVYQTQERSTGSKQTANISIDNLPKGLYIISLTTQKGRVWKGKFEKTR